MTKQTARKNKSKAQRSNSARRSVRASSPIRAQTPAAKGNGRPVAGPSFGLGVPAQAKVTLDQFDAPYEREADSVAEAVSAGQPAPAISRLPAGGLNRPLQRQAVAEEEPGQALTIQRQEASPGETGADDAAFWAWWKHVVGYEGSLADWKARPENKSDRGGETNWGVTKKTYLANAKALGLPATEAGFRAMTPEQAMRFGRMIWKASGARRVKSAGVGLVLADWYWGGIDLGRFSALLEKKGRKATFNQGMPDAATTDFMNSLSPRELVDLMTDAKAAQYRKIARKDPTQEKFLEGWLKRNEERRWQALQTIYPGMSLKTHGEDVLNQARDVLNKGVDASSEEKRAVKDELWTIVALIEQRQEAGFANADEEKAMRNLKGQLLKDIGRLMDAGP